MYRDGRSSDDQRFVFFLSLSAVIFLIHAVYVMKITQKVFSRPVISKQRHVWRLVCECFELDLTCLTGLLRVEWVDE